MAETLEIIVQGRDQASDVLAVVGGKLSAFGADAARVGVLLSVGLTAPLAAVGRTALTTAMDYESAMNVLQATSGATADQMAALDAVAVALGADMDLPATSATDAAQAMLELSKAGLSVTETMAAARGVLELAAAGELSNAEAAKIAANALNAFHLAGSEASRVANLLAAAANASSADVQGMALALRMASAVFAAAGVPIEHLTAAIAEMANAGIQGSDAGTSLKQMLLSLQAPSQTAAALMSELGISVYDASGRLLPMPAIISQFSAALGGLTQEQRNAALATIFGSDAVRAANVVLMGGVEAFDAMTEAVTREGAAHELAAARMAGLRGALLGLQSQIETTMLLAARPFLGVLEDLVRRAADLVGGIGVLNPQVMNAGLAFGVVLAAAGPVAMVIGAISMALGFLVSPIGLVIAATALLAAAWAADWGNVREVTGSVVTAVTGLVGGAVGWLTAAVPAALTVIRTDWGGTWETIRVTVTNVLGSVLAIVEQVIGIVTRSFTEHGENLVFLISVAYDQMRAIVGSVLSAVSVIVQVVLGNVQAFLAKHGAEIQAALERAWMAIGMIVNLTLELIQATVVPVLTAIARFIGDHGAEIQTVLANTWTFIRTIIETTLTIIEGVLRMALAVIRGDWSGAWGAIRLVGETVWAAIVTIVTTALNTIDVVTGGALTAVRAAFVQGWNAALSSTEAALTTVQMVVVDTFNLVTGTIAGAMGTAWTTVQTGWNAALWHTTSAVGEMVNVVTSSFGRVRTTVVEIWEDIRARIVGIVDRLLEGIRGAFAGFRIHIPLPHFSVSWEEIGFGIRIPHVGINWYGRGGDFVADRPMLIGVGEMGAERVQITPMGRRAAGEREGQVRQVTINVYDPVVREELDIGRLAEEIGAVLAGQAQMNRRLQVAWVGSQ